MTFISSIPAWLRLVESPRAAALASVARRTPVRSIVTVRNPRSAGGPQDFSSEGDYWWPDPADPTGPYVRRDGHSNPDNFTAHRSLMLDMARDVGALACAWLLDGREAHAQAAIAHLRAWFMEPATQMNPSLRYAQAIHGRAEGRGIGLIDTVHLAEVALACTHLSPAMQPEVLRVLRNWFDEYLHWFCTHPYGLDEKRQRNNHGLCWWLQAACYARFTANIGMLAECREAFPALIADQMAPDGSLPRELARTRPYAYSVFTLDVLCALATVLSSPQENFMNMKLPDGRGPMAGIDWLYPWLEHPETWPFPADVEYAGHWPVRQPALLFGQLAGGPNVWRDLWLRLDADPHQVEVRRNYPVRQPILWLHQPIG